MVTRLQMLREAKGFNKSELARRSCIQQGVIGWIEAGRFVPYPSQLMKLAEALDYEGEPATLLDSADACRKGE